MGHWVAFRFFGSVCCSLNGTTFRNVLSRQAKFCIINDKYEAARPENIPRIHVAVRCPPRSLRLCGKGKFAIGWVLDRYQVKVDKDSGIRGAPDA